MEHLNNRVKKIIGFFIAIFVLILVVIIVCLLMLKYEVEGEDNMPFELSQIIAVSTAKGIQAEGSSTWNMDIVQNNDIYIHIGKNKNYKETEVIKDVIIDNFKINNAPAKGNLVIYRPSSKENENYEYNEEYIVKDSLIYKGEGNTNLKELKIANQGGVISLRYSNQGLRNIHIRKCRRRNQT